MLDNLKKDYMTRAVLFEHLARIKLRRIHKNNFIFITRYFDDIFEIIKKYRLNVDEIKKTKLKEKIINEIFNKYWTSFDMIEFVLDNKEDRVVKDIKIYEVKTKTSVNKSRFDLCTSSYETYKKLDNNGFKINLIAIVLFENWRYSLNIHPLILSKFREYTRYKEKEENNINNIKYRI